MSANLKISEVMTKSPVCIEATSSLETAISIMEENGFKHIPVVRKGQAEGIASIRDLEMIKSLYGKMGPRGSLCVGDVDNKTEVLLQVSPNDLLKDVTSQMADKKVSAALIVEEGKVMGIFTATDAYRWIASQ